MGRTTTIESEGEDLVLTLDGGGITTAQRQRMIFDGQEHPAESTRLVKRTGATTILYKKLSSREFEAVYKNGGKVVATQKRKVSDDGHVLTSTIEGVDADGKKFSELFVYDKQ